MACNRRVLAIALALGSLVAPSAVLAAAPDSDRDGMPNRFETRYGLNPNSKRDAKKDKDRDRREAGKTGL